MAGSNQTLAIDHGLFTMAFGRDVDFHDMVTQLTYLDRHTGEVLWIYESDDDAYMEAGIAVDENRRERERVATDPDRYLEIPGLDHGDHHDILKAFLRSNWTEDEVRARNAEMAYFGSIGGWKESVSDEDAVHNFYAFREQRITMLAEEFLLENGISPIWK
ncbi:MAG: hypothetical protein ACYTBS_19660 [Planctomycetota bacterium]|jgi:hypothetical protein